MILSASGWRKVFAESGDQEDKTKAIGETNRALSALIAETFAEYITRKTEKENPEIALGMDSRPTGPEIAEAVLKVLLLKGIKVHYVGISSAPEIFTYARKLDGFLYISASHNPVGHNGIKFGLNDGGVIPASEANPLAEVFRNKCASPDSEEHAEKLLLSSDEKLFAEALSHEKENKADALQSYSSFIKQVIAGSANEEEQNQVLDALKESCSQKPLSICCDMNGSSRTLSIDKDFLPSVGLGFYAFNDAAGEIAHAIIPEPENLTHCASFMQEKQFNGQSDLLLGYMPDCDGDRGNLVYWDEQEGIAKPIPAQEVFTLCVVAETAFEFWKKENLTPHGLLQKARQKNDRLAVCVNCPTSMRVDAVCKSFGIELFRAEVGEANVVNLAREKRAEGYTVRILGEGSNGGNITHPSCVRDPLATLFAMVKLLSIRDKTDSNGTLHKGLFHIWCEKSGQEELYKNDFTLSDVLKSLPKFMTTGVSEERAILQVASEDKGKLKERFQSIFAEEWEQHKEPMEAIYGIYSYDAVLTNGTKERVVKDGESWNNGNGGLKVRFYNENKEVIAFIWMRPSGTEPVFRVMCDIQGEETAAERSLLRWETSMIRKADE